MRLGKVGNSDLRLHISWLPVSLLLIGWLGVYYLPGQMPGLTTAVIWIMALITVLLFFLSMGLHELSHIFMARRHQVALQRVELSPIGGQRTYRQPVKTAVAQWQIALAGPVVNLALALFWALITWLANPAGMTSAPTLVLVWLNVAIGLLNLIPAHPLDGFDILLGLLRQFEKNVNLAPRTVTFIGEMTGASMLGAGFVALLVEEIILSISLGFIGWLLQTTNDR